MRLRHVVFAFAASGAAAALVFEWALPSAPPRPAPAAPAPVRSAAAVPPGEPRPPEHFASAPPPPSAVRAAPPPTAAPSEPPLSRPQIDLLQLEERASRRLDLSELLAAAGVDEGALRKRSDAEDILRHLAGDEVLVRGAMRDVLEATIYPAGYPREQIEREVRSQAEAQVAVLSVESRVERLATELERDDVSLPEPQFWGAETGRVYQPPREEEQSADATR